MNGSDGKPLMSGIEVCEVMAEQTDTVLLALSGGKDSLATWLRLRKKGFAVRPFYLFYVPGLKWSEDYLSYLEDQFKTPIHRVIHPVALRWLDEGVFASPGTWSYLRRFEFPGQRMQDAFEDARLDLDMPDGWVAMGSRAVDSMIVLQKLKQGVIRDDLREFYPVWDMDNRKLIADIRRSGIKLPTDYRMFGRSFDGLYAKFTAPLKRHYPEDYRRLRQWFPLIEADIKRWEYFGG